MEIKNSDYAYKSVIQLDEADSTRRYLANVFTWMFVALGVSAFCAYSFYASPNLTALIIDPVTHGYTGLGYVAVFAPLVFSLVMQFGFNRISYPVMVLLFLGYATAIGVSFSVLGFVYVASSIFTVFIGAAGLFAVMAIAGYTTKTDLTSFGSILYIAFIGIFVASLANFFIHSEQFGYIISFVGIAVFVGLTAYYMQVLKRIGAGIEYGTESSQKLVIIGAFILYTTFINLFMMMLRVFGRRR